MNMNRIAILAVVACALTTACTVSTDRTVVEKPVPVTSSAVVVADLDGKDRRLEADILLPFFGLAGDLGPIARWGLALDGYAIAVDPATCATNLAGVFAIGDIATYPGKLKLILQGFSEAAVAAHAAHAVARPGTALHFEYSTTTGVPER